MNAVARSGLVIISQLLLSVSIQAQPKSAILGRVIDASTTQPIPFATVYINTSTRGTTADAEGNYQLTGVPVGTVELVASSVGFKAGRQTIRVSETNQNRVTFYLTPTANALQQVTVTAKRSGAYNRMLRTFQRELLGNTPFADKCQITNLETVRLTLEDGRLKAQLGEPLVIDNRALGYRLYYDLSHFESFRQVTYYGGTSRFEALLPANAEEADRWKRNQQKAYLGSVRHLVASLIAGTYEQEGFLVYNATFDVPADPSIPVVQSSRDRPTVRTQPDSLLKPAQLPSERQLFSPRPLEVFYTRQHVMSTPYREMPYAYSLLYMPKGKAAIVTTDGWIAQPNGLETRGAMSSDRLATLLPVDWKPAQQPANTLAAGSAGGAVLPEDTLLRSLVKAWEGRQKVATPAVFLHIDKGIYATGDQLWFSGYVVNPTTYQPAATTIGTDENPVHIELSAPDGRLVHHQWARVTAGRASGSFRLSDSLTTGTYRLRAYPEADAANVRPAFERPVTIINSLSLPTGLPAIAPPAGSDSIDVQFLPEGGHWVVGLPARLGIKAIDRQGNGVAVAGRIQSGPTEAGRFSTNHLGIGSVDLLPLPNQLYTAEMNTPFGPLRVALPPVDPDGLVLATDVVTDSTRLSIRVQASAQLAGQPVYLTVQSRGQLVQQTKLQLSKGSAQLTIPVATLPVGVAQVTLFSAQGIPQAERLVFIPERVLPIQTEVITNKTTHQPRESVAIALRVADGLGEPLSLIGSVSVTDADQQPADTNAADIRTHLLLTGDLRGRVENANGYLKSNRIDVRRALDDLVLTQGWRRLNWQFGAVKAGTGIPVATGMLLRGRVLDKKDKALPNANVLFTFTDRRGAAFARSARTDQQGRFLLDELVLTDTVTVKTRVMTPAFTPISSAYVVMDTPGGYFRSSGPVAIGLPVAKMLLPAIQQRQAGNPAQYRDRDARQLQEVTVRAAKPDDDTQARRASLHGKPDVTLLFDEKSRSYANTYEMLAGGVPGVQVSASSGGNGYTVTVRGPSSVLKAPAPLYIIDGQYIAENSQGNILFMLNPREIERIEVVKNSGGAIYGARGGAGTIAFFTRKGSSAEPKTANPDQQTHTLQGYLTEREFYTPGFGPPSGQPAAQPDRRDVLYWKPMLTTDGHGVTTLQFPLSDVSRRIRITLQGISTDGRPVVIERVLRAW